MEEIKKRVTAWKKVFTEGRDDLNENSSWKDILLTLDLSLKENIALVARCSRDCGGFTPDEKKLLKQLPYYDEIIDLLRELLNGNYGNFFSSELPCGDAIYFLRYPKQDEPQREVTLIEVTIVLQEPFKCDLDVYTFISGYKRTKNVIINYADEVPQNWLDEFNAFVSAESEELAF